MIKSVFAAIAYLTGGAAAIMLLLSMPHVDDLLTDPTMGRLFVACLAVALVSAGFYKVIDNTSPK